METLRQKLDSEMEIFTKTYKNMTTTQVYNDWYVIMFYESYYDYLLSLIEYFVLKSVRDSEDLYYYDIIKWLNTFDNPLGFLYNEWLNCCGEFSLKCDDMIDWLSDLKRKYILKKDE